MLGMDVGTCGHRKIVQKDPALSASIKSCGHLIVILPLPAMLSQETVGPVDVPC